MRAGSNHAAVQRTHKIGRLGRGACCDFWNGRKTALLVTGVYALGAIAYGEVLIELEI